MLGHTCLSTAAIGKTPIPNSLSFHCSMGDGKPKPGFAHVEQRWILRFFDIFCALFRESKMQMLFVFC